MFWIVKMKLTNKYYISTFKSSITDNACYSGWRELHYLVYWREASRDQTEFSLPRRLPNVPLQVFILYSLCPHFTILCVVFVHIEIFQVDKSGLLNIFIYHSQEVFWPCCLCWNESSLAFPLDLNQKEIPQLEKAVNKQSY